MKLLEHQSEALEKLHNGSILYGGVGSGKSLTAACYYMKHEKPKDVYVITTAKKRDSLDWESVFAQFGVGTEKGGTVAGVLTIDSWNNIAKYEMIEDAFFILDEQRLVGSGAWVKAFLRIAKRNRWIMLSATPGDTYLDFVPMFIANGLYRNRAQFLQEHVVFAPFLKYPKIVRYVDVATLDKYKNMLLVEMPYLSPNTSIVTEIAVSYDTEKFDIAFKKRWNPYEDQPIVDVAELFRVMRKIVNSDRSRLNALLQLMETHPRIVVFYNFNYELDILRELIDVTSVSEWNGHRKQPIPNTDNWVYLVQYVAGAEGWNCTETDTMVFYSLTYSYKNFEQAKGRINRLNNRYNVLNYYIFLSNSVIDHAVRRSLTMKKLFNERKWLAENEGFEEDFAA